MPAFRLPFPSALLPPAPQLLQAYCLSLSSILPLLHQEFFGALFLPLAGKLFAYIGGFLRFLFRRACRHYTPASFAKITFCQKIVVFSPFSPISIAIVVLSVHGAPALHSFQNTCQPFRPSQLWSNLALTGCPRSGSLTPVHSFSRLAGQVSQHSSATTVLTN